MWKMTHTYLSTTCSPAAIPLNPLLQFWASFLCSPASTLNHNYFTYLSSWNGVCSTICHVTPMHCQERKDSVIHLSSSAKVLAFIHFQNMNSWYQKFNSWYQQLHFWYQQFLFSQVKSMSAIQNQLLISRTDF